MGSWPDRDRSGEAPPPGYLLTLKKLVAPQDLQETNVPYLPEMGLAGEPHSAHLRGVSGQSPRHLT